MAGTGDDDITWGYLRDWLVRELMIDAEWLVDGEQEFSWWPWFLRQRIAVTNVALLGKEPNQDVLIRVTATIDVLAYDDEKSGTAVVQGFNDFFPFGAWVWNDGVISMTSSLAVNRQCLDLLPQFRDACLVQAAHSHETVRHLSEELRELALVSAHPTSGLREAPDDLLSIYRDGQFHLETSAATVSAFRVGRERCAGILADFGIDRVVAGPTCDAYEVNGQMVSIGEEFDSPTASSFGPGLAVLVVALPPGPRVPAEIVNDGNLVLAHAPTTSHLGVLMSNEGAPQYGSAIRTLLSYPYLAKLAHNPADLGTSMVNAVLHAAQAAHALKH